MRSRFFVLSALFALIACGGGGEAHGPSAAPPLPAGAAPASALAAIPEVVSQNGVASLSLTAKLDENGRPSFFYNGAKVAPTIRVQPGDTIKLHFLNELPEYCAVGVMSNSNLHFHGLTTSPNAPADEVITTNAAPTGGTADYAVPVDADQPPGLYWYHPHPHGLTAWEVGNGMAGAIVVEGIANDVPAASGVRERVLVLGDLPIDASFAATESAATKRGALRRRVSAARSAADVEGAACSAETDATPTVNGAKFATIGIRPGETQLFRVVNGSGHRTFDLSVDGAQLQLVAQDGVPIRAYPGAPTSLAVSDVVIPPAGRAEFLVTAPAATTALISKCYDAGPAGDVNPQTVLGALADDSTWRTAGPVAQTRVRAAASAPRRSAFYRIALPAAAAQRTIRFSEDDNGFYLDGKAYDPAGPPSVVARSGTVEEWTLENDSDEVHAFHIHQVHFVIESINGAAQPNAHWLDTYNIPPQGIGVQGQRHPSVVKVLIDFRDPIVRGTFLYHCHILDHEDRGMMAKIQVI